jgi:hypothetical protein
LAHWAFITHIYAIYSTPKQFYKSGLDCNGWRKRREKQDERELAARAMTEEHVEREEKYDSMRWEHLRRDLIGVIIFCAYM